MWPYGYDIRPKPYSSEWTLAQENAELRQENAKLETLASAHRSALGEAHVTISTLKEQIAVLRSRLEKRDTFANQRTLEQRIDALEAAGHFPTHRPPTFEADYILDTPTGRQYLYGRESAVKALKSLIAGLTSKLSLARAALDGK